MPIAIHEYEYIRELCRTRAGIILDAGKEYLVESRLGPLIRKLNVKSTEELIQKMRYGPTAIPYTQAVIEAMTTNETSFFRDQHPFDALKETIIPELLKRRIDSKTINIWCAAASSGQEPYTIAMVIRENFGHLLATGWKINIVATDINAEMIARCKAGRFTQLEINRGLPAALMVKYFKKHGMEWEIDDSLKKMIDFRECNLCTDWTNLNHLDVVFMRNVLIYFSLETKRQILARVRRSMRADGYLFMGGAETTLNIDDAYDRVQIVKSGIYQIRQAA